MKRATRTVFTMASLMVLSTGGQGAPLENFAETATPSSAVEVVKKRGDEVVLKARGAHSLQDGETLEEARRLAQQDAKSKVLERAGNYLVSETVLEQGEITSERVASFMAANLVTRVLSSTLLTRPEGKVYQVEIEARIDQKKTALRLSEMVKLKQQEQRIRELEGQNEQLTTLLEHYQEVDKGPGNGAALEKSINGTKLLAELRKEEKVDLDVSNRRASIENLWEPILRNVSISIGTPKVERSKEGVGFNLEVSVTTRIPSDVIDKVGTWAAEQPYIKVRAWNRFEGPPSSPPYFTPSVYDDSPGGDDTFSIRDMDSDIKFNEETSLVLRVKLGGKVLEAEPYRSERLTTFTAKRVRPEFRFTGVSKDQLESLNGVEVEPFVRFPNGNRLLPLAGSSS